MISGDKEESYYLYLEGLANEVMHILQRRRRDLGLDIMDTVDVYLVQAVPDKLTSAIYMFVDAIVKRVRINEFSPNSNLDVELKVCEFTCPLGRTYTFDLYMRKV